MLVEIVQLLSAGIVTLLRVAVEGTDGLLFCLSTRFFKALNALLLAAIRPLLLSPRRITNTELVHHQKSAPFFKLLEVGEAALWNHGDLSNVVMRSEEVNSLLVFVELGVQRKVTLVYGEHAVGYGLG